MHEAAKCKCISNGMSYITHFHVPCAPFFNERVHFRVDASPFQLVELLRCVMSQKNNKNTGHFIFSEVFLEKWPCFNPSDNAFFR